MNLSGQRYDNLKIFLNLAFMLKGGHGFSFSSIWRKFSNCHISVKFSSISKKSVSFGKHYWTTRSPPYFFKSMQDHCKKSEELKYFISNFRSFVTQLKLVRFTKSWVVLKSSWSELQENYISCWIWSIISHSTARLLCGPVIRSKGVQYM